MKIFLCLLYFLIASVAHSESKDTWMCTDESAERQGAVWTACGIGEASSEGSARAQALAAAIQEFGRICAISSDCNERNRTVEPKRTTCLLSKSGGYWKCYRMIQVTILN